MYIMVNINNTIWRVIILASQEAIRMEVASIRNMLVNIMLVFYLLGRKAYYYTISI